MVRKRVCQSRCESQPANRLDLLCGRATVLTLERPVLGLSWLWGVERASTTATMSCNMPFPSVNFRPFSLGFGQGPEQRRKKEDMQRRCRITQLGTSSGLKVDGVSHKGAFVPPPSSRCPVSTVVRRHDASRVHELIEDCQP